MSDQVTITIDGQEVSVPPGTLVVDAAAKLNIEIPVFCSHPKLDPVACCRMCLVEFETPRGNRLLPACAERAREGTVVHTETQLVKDTQEANLAFILLNHPLDCPICDKGGECPLQDQTMRFGSGISQLVEPKRLKHKEHMISDTIVLDQERCVVCWRCIRYLNEWEDKPQLDLFERGGETLIDIQKGQPVDAKTGGNIIDICPVGALTNKVSRFSYRPWQVERIPSICPHFPTGDNIRVDVRTHELRRIIGRENMAVNDQWIADKTRFSFAWVNSEDRLTMPLMRKQGVLTPVSWGEALTYVGDRLSGIKHRYGGESIGGIGSAKLSNESNYLLQRFMRQVINTNNIDHRDGGEVSTIPTGIPALADVMKPQDGPNPKVDTIFLFGVDPSEEAPILDLHLKRAVRFGGVKLIIIHSRQIELTRYDGPYMSVKPGTEVTLLNEITKAAVAISGQKQPSILEQSMADVTDEVLQACGVDEVTIKQAAEMLTQSENALILYGPMVARGEAGQQVVQALTNLAIVTNHYESLAYMGLDANSQGCLDMGVLPEQLPGHQPIHDEDARSRFENVWDCTLPTESGKTYKEMMESAGDGVQALYIMGANPASERPEWAINLDKLDFLVVQELFLTETAQKADVVLPAVSWVESNGTFTNAERRVQRAPKAVQNPKSKAAADWMIIDHLANSMGAGWSYKNWRDINNEITQVVSIYNGLGWDALGEEGLQWDAAVVRSEPFLQEAIQPELPSDEDYPFALVTGTVCYDGGNMFSLTKQMENIAVGAMVGLNPQDAKNLNITEGTDIVVSNVHGSLALKAKIESQVVQGTAWIPESLPGAPVGTLLNGHYNEYVQIRQSESAHN